MKKNYRPMQTCFCFAFYNSLFRAKDTHHIHDLLVSGEMLKYISGPG